MDKSLTPINLYYVANHFKHDTNVSFNPEVFPALSLHYWNPIHVNIFSTGKIIVLGNNSINLLTEIYEWIFYNLLLL